MSPRYQRVGVRRGAGVVQEAKEPGPSPSRNTKAEVSLARPKVCLDPHLCYSYHSPQHSPGRRRGGGGGRGEKKTHDEGEEKERCRMKRNGKEELIGSCGSSGCWGRREEEEGVAVAVAGQVSY